MRASVRPSAYIVQSDEALINGPGGRVRVVLQSATSQVYLLAEKTLDTLLNRPSDLPDAEFAEMIEAGLLVAAERDEFAETVAENKAEIQRNSVRSFVLMPAAYCNMGCGYCGQQHVRLPTSASHRAAVVNRLLMAVRSERTSGLYVSWFGAEPMMGYSQILDIATQVIPACESAGKTFTSHMVTNGALLTMSKLRRLYHDARVKSFEITLDGPPERHNEQRPLKSGQGSYDRITGLIAEACRQDDLADLRISIRTNISRANQNDYEAFAAAASAAGIVHPRVRFYPALVREWGNDVSEFAVARPDIVEIERNWLDAYAKYGMRGADELPIGRTRTVCVTVNPQSEVIAPAGEVYTCTEMPLVPSRAGMDVGHVADLQTPAARPVGPLDDWNDRLVEGKTNAYCPTCSIFPICGGYCPLVWSEGSPACPPLKATMPMRLTRYGQSLGLEVAPSH